MPSVPHPTRRRLLAAGAFAMTGIIGDGGAAAAPLPVTPQCHDGDEPTVRQTAGPYFKPSSPQRADLVESGSKGRVVELAGLVLTRPCRPAPRARGVFCHADDRRPKPNPRFRHPDDSFPG